MLAAQLSCIVLWNTRGLKQSYYPQEPSSFLLYSFQREIISYNMKIFTYVPGIAFDSKDSREDTRPALFPVLKITLA